MKKSMKICMIALPVVLALLVACGFTMQKIFENKTASSSVQGSHTDAVKTGAQTKTTTLATGKPVVLKKLLENIANAPFVPDTYTETVKTGGEIEAKYLSAGSHDVAYFESAALMSFEKYEIYYPADIAEIDGPLPVIVYVNGTGTVASRYPALQKHMASWGFITIATEETNSWYGFSSEMSVRYLEKINEQEELNGKENIFYHKIDINNIGITGQSQGGFGVVNAATNHRHADNYKAAVILSCNAQTNADLQWEADATLMNVPTLIMGTTGGLDALIANPQTLKLLYSQIPEDTDKMIALRNDGDHSQSLYYMDGYVTAWFMYYLQGDRGAAAAFTGETPEIKSNSFYQDVESNLS